AVALADRDGFGIVRQVHLVERADLEARAVAAVALRSVGRRSIVEPLASAPAPWIVHARCAACPADRSAAEAPGGLVAEAGGSLESGDLRFGHTLEEVVGLVVLRRVAPAEPVAVLRCSPLARNMDGARGIGLGRLAHAGIVTTFEFATPYCIVRLP